MSGVQLKTSSPRYMNRVKLSPRTSFFSLLLLGCAGLHGISFRTTGSRPDEKNGRYIPSDAIEFYVPEELSSLLVCITFRWNVGRW